MKIARADETEHTEFLALVNAEIRPGRAKTKAWEDFPLILGADNRDCVLVCKAPDGRLAGGIACLIREFKTSCGVIPVAGMGSVVTHPEFRGKGLSAALQNEMLKLIRGKNVPLAVLWTDQPEIYSGRGFAPAGWEIHAQLDQVEPSEPSATSMRVRDYSPEDAPAVEKIYHRHPLGTIRRPGDSASLYAMPGTRGLVGVNETGEILAAVFCGKGADFPDYIAEWDGPHQLAVALMTAARDRGLAKRVLIPAGEEVLVNSLVDRGASWFSLPSGYWKVLDPGFLAGAVTGSGQIPPTMGEDAGAWLGSIDDQGQPLVGPLTVAVWGFDSV